MKEGNPERRLGEVGLYHAFPGPGCSLFWHASLTKAAVLALQTRADANNSLGDHSVQMPDGMPMSWKLLLASPTKVKHRAMKLWHRRWGASFLEVVGGQTRTVHTYKLLK